MATFPRAKVVRFNEVAGSGKPLLGTRSKSDCGLQPKPLKSRQGCSDKSNTLFHSQRPKERTSSEKGKVNHKEYSSQEKSHNEIRMMESKGESYVENSHNRDTETNKPAHMWIDLINVDIVSCRGAKRLRSICHKLASYDINQLPAPIYQMIVMTLQEVRGKMQQVESKMESYENCNKDLNKKILILQEEILQYQLYICKLRSDLERMSLKENDAEHTSAKLTNEIINRDEVIEANEREIQNLERQICEKCNINKNLEAELIDISKKLVVPKDRNNQLAMDSIQLRRRISLKDAENQSLTCLIAELGVETNKEIREAREEHARITDLLRLVQENMEEKDNLLLSTFNKLEKMLESISDHNEGMSFSLSGNSKDSKYNVGISIEDWKSNLAILEELIGMVVARIIKNQVDKKTEKLKEKLDEMHQLESSVEP